MARTKRRSSAGTRVVKPKRTFGFKDVGRLHELYVDDKNKTLFGADTSLHHTSRGEVTYIYSPTDARPVDESLGAPAIERFSNLSKVRSSVERLGNKFNTAFESLETARAASHASRWYHRPGVRESVFRGQLARWKSDPDGDAMRRLVFSELKDVPSGFEDIAREFGPEIKRVIDTGSPADSLLLATRIALARGWVEPVKDDEGEGEEPGSGEGGEGKDEGEGNPDGKDEGKDGKDGKVIDGVPNPEGPKRGFVAKVASKHGEVDTARATLAKALGERPENLEAALFLKPVVKFDWNKIARHEAAIGNNVAPSSIKDPEGKIADWIITTPKLAYEQHVLHEQVKHVLSLDKGDGAMYRTTGDAGKRVWRLNYGTVNVFEKPRKTKGRIVIMVDQSGSMDCACLACNKHGGYYHSGYLAFQIANAIALEHPQTQIYGYSGSHSQIRGNLIAPIPAGYIPAHGSSSGWLYDNCDCAALRYMDALLDGEYSNAVGILIADGGPTRAIHKYRDVTGRRGGDYFSECNGERHMKEMGQLLYDKGVRFGFIGVNYHGEGLIPQDITVRVTSLAEIENVTPLFEYLEAKG